MNIIPRTSGIYRITCTVNNRIYIGSAKNFYRRWMSHWQALKRGDHKNRHLQNAWNKHGEQSFVFEIIELCEFDVLLKQEQHYIDTLKPFSPNGFNISPSAHAGMNGLKHSPESIEKMRSKKRGKKMSDGMKAKISAYHKGRPHSPEHAAKIGEANRKRVYSDETKEKLRIAAKNMSQQQRDQIATAQSKTYILTTPDGVEISVFNLEQFCRENTLHASALREVAHGKRAHYKRWLCRHA